MSATMRPFMLSRRTLLRGAGVAVGLPVLEPMIGRRGLLRNAALAAVDPPPVYLTVFYVPLGIFTETWVPDRVGPDFDITPGLAPLAPFRSKMTVLSGLSKLEQLYKSNSNVTPGDAHGTEGGHFTTGMLLTKGNNSGHPSLDQYVAEKRAGQTKFNSLPVAVGKASGLPVHHTISWDGAGAPVIPERDVLKLYDRLFSLAPDGGTASKLVALRKSVLDHVKGDLGRL